MKETIGLLGVGNMGTAILEGLFEKKISAPPRVWIYDKIKAKPRDFAKKWKIHTAQSAGELARQSRWILLAVKPQDLLAVGAELKGVLTARQGLISILAGTPILKLRKAVGAKAAIVRAMPNLGAKVGESMTVVTGGTREALGAAREIFNGCGRTLTLPERFFDLVTALSGSGPAYFFYLMEMLAGFGISEGLSQKNAELLAIQTAMGAGKLAAAFPVSPKEWKDRVTSKKGTTEAALKVLKRSGADLVFARAFRAALNRGRELSGS